MGRRATVLRIWTGEIDATGLPEPLGLQGSFNHMRVKSHALHDFTLSLFRNPRRQSCNHMNRAALKSHDDADA